MVPAMLAPPLLDALIDRILHEDLAGGDLTTEACVDPAAQAAGEAVARKPLVVEAAPKKSNHATPMAMEMNFAPPAAMPMESGPPAGAPPPEAGPAPRAGGRRGRGRGGNESSPDGPVMVVPMSTPMPSPE